ncbi:MAG TPA: hypothetical protein PKZ84_13250 [Anaerolineae bacterium]|nr:hypothetical protein [Anaerolineae bacterium]HQI87657.1 hypothetical protein [Anaerolineae bacterium]
MLILVVGAKGGIGTTTLAQHLCRQANAVPLDAADGTLALQMAGPGAPVLDLIGIVQWTADQRGHAVEYAVETRQPLLWTPACTVWHAPVMAFVWDAAALGHVIADGGTTPPPALVDLASLLLIVSADTPVAQWHERRLKQQWPQAHAVLGDLKAVAQAIAEETLGVPARKGLLDKTRPTLGKGSKK